MKTCLRGHKYSGSGPCPVCWPGHYAKKQSFSDKVVEAALSVPKGRVTTYGRLARAAGAGPMASQSITSILAKASDAGKKIPFHRIVYADGRVWVDAKHKAERLKLYKKEGIKIDAKGRIENFGDVLYEFN